MSPPYPPRANSRTELGRESWAATPSSLRPMRRAVTCWLWPLSLTPQVRSDLILATHEAALNSIEHAYFTPTPHNTVELRLWTEATEVCIEIVDHGQWRPPTPLPNGRGYGLALIRQIIETVMIQNNTSGTRVLLRHPLNQHTHSTTR